MSLNLSVFREDPLTLYVFSSVAAFKNKGVFHICKGVSEMSDFSLVFDNTRSGSCVANDCVIIAGADGLPFGGTGGSGCTWFWIDHPILPWPILSVLDGYHTGKFSFNMFTHLRASIDSPSW